MKSINFIFGILIGIIVANFILESSESFLPHVKICKSLVSMSKNQSDAYAWLFYGVALLIPIFLIKKWCNELGEGMTDDFDRMTIRIIGVSLSMIGILVVIGIIGYQMVCCFVR